MTYDFEIWIALIIIALLMVIGAFTKGVLYNVLTVPFLIFLIIRVQSIPDPGLFTTGLAGLTIFNIYITIDRIITHEGA